MKKISQFLLIVTLSLSLTACGSFGRKMKSWLGGGPSAEEIAAKKKLRKPTGHGTAYSKNKNLRADDTNRRYTRMSKDQFEDQARIEEKQGSLWEMEGQESYLFAQNMMRLKGDILDVEIEGSPRKQLETKVQVINKLLQRLKEAQEKKARLAKAKATGKKPKRKPASKSSSKAKEKELFDVEKVPVRIVEKLNNGNYRVRGGQNFMIDKREYKVIVTGIVKAGDIDSNSVKSSQLLDSKFDIVSPRREANL